MNYYNDKDIEVTKHISQKNTFFIEDNSYEAYVEAFEEAEKRNTYVYEVFADKKQDRRVHVGYGVPK